MRKFLLFTLALAANCVMADDSVYINVNAGLNTNNNQGAYNANVGYMLNKYIGIEGGYTEADANYWDGAVKGVLPLLPILDVYAKVGMSYIAASGVSNGAILYGVGVDFPILPYFQINVEDYAISNYSSQNFLMAGLQFKF